MKPTESVIIATALAMLCDKEFLTPYDVNQELMSQGYDTSAPKLLAESCPITDALKKLEDDGEAIRTHPGFNRFIKRTENLTFAEQLMAEFYRCRPPSEYTLTDWNRDNMHSYIEDGVAFDRSDAIPVPPGSRVFVRLYHPKVYNKYNAVFYSHVYMYQPPNGPLMSMNMWFHGRTNA